MASTLLEWKLQKVCVITCDGRFLIGQLMGHDQVQNLILNEAIELLYSEEESVEQVPLGLYVIRGDNVAIVGEYTKTIDMKCKTEPLPAIHQQLL